MESLQGKVVVITGASSGTGRETAVYMAKFGPRLVLVARNEINLNVTKDLCVEAGLNSDQVICVIADVTEDDKRKEIIEKTISTFGKLDVLINNAGRAEPSDASMYTLTEDDFLKEIKVNVGAPLFLSRLAIPYLKESKGCIVNVSSEYSRTPGEHLCGYRMSKAALDMATKTLATELVSHGVRVNSINPGLVKTNMIKASMGVSDEEQEAMYKQLESLQPLGQGKPDDIAKLIAVLASDISSHMTGQIVFATGNVSL